MPLLLLIDSFILSYLQYYTYVCIDESHLVEAGAPDAHTAIQLFDHCLLLVPLALIISALFYNGTTNTTTTITTCTYTRSVTTAKTSI